jgi:twitching motility protein PilT
MLDILKVAVQRGASDIHLKPGDVFRIRINGELVPLTKQRLTPEQTRQVALQLIPNDADRDRIDEIRDYDCSWGAAGIGRFRVNILRQRGTIMIVLRVVAVEIPTLEALQLPSVLGRIAASPRGMVLVTGITGVGKSTTLAAMVDHINRTQSKHIITLEQPIEFLHRDNVSSITQRDIGTDTESFATGLRAALREDPDIILVGEMRDTNTIETALKAAETGHLVLSTLHTTNAVQTVIRIAGVFPPHEQDMIRVRLAESLVSVVSQRLLPRKDGSGRIAACEIMIATSAIRDAIRAGEEMDKIHELMEEGRDQYGSQSFDQHLTELLEAGLVSFEVAKAAASRPDDFELKVRTLA